MNPNPPDGGTRFRARSAGCATGSAVVAALAVAFLGACSDTTRADRPDPAEFHFPTAVVADPAGAWVYVVSSNFDSLYTGGTIVPIDVASRTVVPAGAVEVGSFAGELALVPGADGRGAGAYLALRDDDALLHLDLAWSDEGQPSFRCAAQPAEGLARCDGDRSVDVLDLLKDAVPEEERDDVPEARDPFAILAGAPVRLDGPEGVIDEGRPLYVGSLRDGVFLVFTLGADGVPAFKAGLELEAGLHSFVEWPVSARERVVVASNRMTALLHVIRVHLKADGTVDAVLEEPVQFDQLAATGDYYRGMAMSRVGPWLYAAYRSPPALAVLEFGADGRPVQRGLVGLYGAPGYVATWAPPDRPEDERVYVTDFTGDALYAIDPWTMTVTDRIEVGAGPYGLAIAGDMAWVADFEEGAVSVVPLDPSHPEWHREIERLKP